jgi:hypothetical protein
VPSCLFIIITNKNETKSIPIKKDFDCIEMKNAIQAKIYAETKDIFPA